MSLTFIKKGRDLGFSIDEIRALLEMADGQAFPCGEVRDLTQDHLANVQAKIADLLKLETALKGMIAECSKGDVPECPIIDTLFSSN